MEQRTWPAHVWHDCAVHGHPWTSEGNCPSCDGGLGGCVVCGAWEGEIRDYDRCIGVNPTKANTLEDLNVILDYHYGVAPILRPAKSDDMSVGLFVVVFDAGAWQYPGRIVAVVDATNARVRTPYDGDEGPALVPLEWEPGVPGLGVYDPMNAFPAKE